MINIIFNGPPGSGKDDACLFLSSNYRFKHKQIKEELFIETAKYFDVSLEWFMTGYDNRETKERPEMKLQGLSRREALIHTSEDVIKPKYGKDYFGVKTAKKLDMSSSYCFSDGGFIEEVFPLINAVGADNLCIVQLYRHGCSYTADSRNYIFGNFRDEFTLGFKSEHTISSTTETLPLRMYQVHNNGSVGDFHRIIGTIVLREAVARLELKDKAANDITKRYQNMYDK